MDRRVLDALAAHHDLSRDGVAGLLELAEARPGRVDIERFVVRIMHLAGVLSIAAGVVFFVAANWSALPVFGRFALVEAVLATVIGLALWRPPPHAVGRYALLVAFIVSGALFALFGQTYQTGADVYELFLNWALLGLGLVLAAQWSVAWAAWVLVLNVAMWLFCGARPEAGVLWALASSWTLSTSQLLLVPLGVDVALWAASVLARGRAAERLAPRWLGRFALACGVASGTWAGMIVVLAGAGNEGAAGLMVPLIVFAAVGLYSVRRRVDLFPLAAIEGSLIVLGATWIIEVGNFGDIGLFFVLAAWLILASTVSGRSLMRLVRRWESQGAAP